MGWSRGTDVATKARFSVLSSTTFEFGRVVRFYRSLKTDYSVVFIVLYNALW